MRAVIYARYSGGPKQTDQSIEGQVSVCKKRIKQEGYTFVKTYADRHISGRSDNRPEFQQMIKDSEKDLYDVLVLYSSDRFSRDRYDSAKYKKILKDNGIKIIYAAENIPDGPEGVLLESLMEGWAQYFSEELARKVKRGMLESAKKGKATGGVTTFGYQVNDQKEYEIDPYNAEAVKMIFSFYNQGFTFTEIAEKINAKGYLTVKGKPFKGAGIKRILENKKYTGVYSWAGTEIEGGLPQIINPILFECTQEKLSTKHLGPSANFKLQSKLVCGVCGKGFKGVSGTSKTGSVYYYYHPHCDHFKNIRKDKLEDFIDIKVRSSFKKTSRLKNLLNKINILGEEKLSSMAAVGPQKALVTRLNKEADSLVDQIIDSSEPRIIDKLERKVHRIEERIKQTEEKIRQTEELKKTLTKENLEKALLNYIENSDQIIPTFVDKILLFEDHVILEFNLINPESLELERDSEFIQSSAWYAEDKKYELFIPKINGFYLVICNTSTLLH